MKMTKVDALNIALSTLTADSYDVKYDVLLSDGTSTIRTETFTQQEVQEVEVEEVTEEPAAPVVEEVKKPTTTRKPRAKKTASEGGDFDANAVVARINAAKSEEELAVIREEIKNDEKIGRIAADLAEYFGQVIENRFVDFEDAEDEANETKRREMEANLYDLTREVRSQPDAAGLKAVVDKAAKWRDAGDIDLEMFRQVVEEAKKRSASFTQGV